MEVTKNSMYSLMNLEKGTRKAELNLSRTEILPTPPPLWEQFACTKYTLSSILNTTEMLQLCPRGGGLPESRQACEWEKSIYGIHYRWSSVSLPHTPVS